jgi:hypothetical protein
MSTASPTMTFESLAQRQPALLALRRRARAGRHLAGWERATFWRDIKRELSGVVGWFAEPPTDASLRTCDAFDVCYGELLLALEGP